MTPTKPRTVKRVVKAWAIVCNSGDEYDGELEGYLKGVDIFFKREDALERVERSYKFPHKAVPCTITYSLPKPKITNNRK